MKRILKWFCFLCFSILTLWVIVLGTLQTKWGQKWAFRTFANYLEKTTQTRVKVKGIHFSFPFQLNLDEVFLSQEGHPIIEIHDLKLCCATSSLLNGRIILSQVAANQLIILELPTPSQSSAENPPSLWEHFPLPLYLKLKSLDIKEIKFSDNFLQKIEMPIEIKKWFLETPLSLSGFITNNPFKSSLSANLLISNKVSSKSIPFELGIEIEDHQLTTNLKLEDRNLFLKGKGILNEDGTISKTRFAGKIQNIADWIPSIEKKAKLPLSFSGNLSGNLLFPRINLQIESPAITIFDNSFPHLKSIITAQLRNGQMEGNVSISFEYANQPFTASTPFQISPRESISLSLLHIDYQYGHIQGALSSRSPDFLLDGFLNIDVDDLNSFSPFFNIPIRGSGEGKLTFSKNHQKQQIHADIIAHSLKWNDREANELSFYLDVDPSLENEKLFHIHGLFNGQEIQWKDYHISNTRVDLSTLFDISQKQFTESSLDGEIENIRWTDGSIAKAAGKFQTNFPLTAESELNGKLNFTFQDCLISSIRCDEINGSTEFLSQESWPFQMEGKGKWKDSYSFTSAGLWHWKNDFLKIQLDNLKGNLGILPFQIQESLLLQNHENEFLLDHLSLQIGEGEIQGKALLDKENIAAQFKTNAFPSKLISLIYPELPLSGKTSFQGEINGTLHHPKGELQIQLHDLQVIEDVFASKPLISGDVFLHFDEKGVQIQSNLNGVGNTPLLVNGTLPYSFSLVPYQFEVNPDLPFQVSLKAEGELDPYLHLFYNDTTNLSAHAKISLQLSGKIDSPQIEGNIDLLNGTYESLSTGALYRDIQARLEGNGSKIILTHLYAVDNKQGHILATGQLLLNPAEKFPFDFQIIPSRIFIIDSDYIDISASGSLHLIGNTEGAKLVGELTVDQASIHLEEALPRDIKTVDVQYLNVDETDSMTAMRTKPESHLPIEFNVKLNAAENIKIEGKHLKSDWKGSLIATGAPKNILLNGDLRLVQGEYDFKGKVFNLTQGNIHFAGSPDKKTTLYIVASKEIDKITADIIVKGPTNKPAISFRSSPPLSQREVLSYILFNHGISDITQSQGDQLSQSFISLNADQTGSSDDFLSRLRNNIGIDLNFTTGNSTDNKQPGLQVGVNITEDIKVSAGSQNMTSLTPVIAVEAKLRKNIKAQAETSIDNPIQMSIKWKKDY